MTDTMEDELFLVMCMSCERQFLAGTGDDEDPALDITYDPMLRIFVCDGCYGNSEGSTQHWKTLSNN